MTRPGKQRAEREATAAYAASQPLFDALRTGCMRVDEQKTSLSTARDMVQQVHVKLPTPDSKAEEQRYQRSIDCVIEAWRSATATYADIFDSLAKVTAADSAEGKGERHGHDQFVKMARMAAVANDAALKQPLWEDLTKMKSEGPGSAAALPEDDDDGKVSSPSERSQKSPADAAHTNSSSRNSWHVDPKRKHDEPVQKTERQSKKIKHDSKMGSGSSENFKQGPGKEQSEDTAKPTQGAAKHARSLPDRRARGDVEDLPKPVSTQDFISLNGATKPEAVPQPAIEVLPVPGVEYRDMSAEVEARLKAKEEKRAAAKKEKKRKRESGDSLGAAEVDFKTEKPKTKKLKEEPTKQDPTVNPKKDKRKKDNRESGEVVDGETRKKRKKA